MLNCHHNAHPCLDTRGGGSCEYFKAGSKTVGLMAGDYIHMTFIIPQISLLSRHFLQTRYRLLQTVRWQNILHIYCLCTCTSLNYL